MKKETKLILLFWGLLYAFLLVCNILLPPVSDDFIHMEIAKGGFKAAVENYMTTNARFGQCLLCWFAGAMPPIAFDVLNALIGTFFIFLLFVLIEGRIPASRSDYGELSFILIVILLATMFGSVFLWMSGATNYLWGYTLIALHWIPYRYYWKNGEFQLKKWAVVPFFFLSIFAGWCSEQVGIMSILIHLGLIGYGLIAKKMKFPVWVWAGFVGFVIGFLVLYFSPGIGARSDGATAYMSLSQVLSLGAVGIARRLILTIGYASSKEAFDIFFLSATCFVLVKKNCKKAVLVSILALLLIGLGLLKLEPIPIQVAYFYFRIFFSIILFIIAIRYSFKKNLFAIIYVVYFIGLLSTIQIIGHIPERAKFAQSFLLIAISIYLIKGLYPDFMSKRIIHVVCGLCMLVVVIAFIDFNRKQQAVFSLIESTKVSGKEIVYIPSNMFQSAYKNLGDWGNPDKNPEHWANKGYADWFGVERVYVLE